MTALESLRLMVQYNSLGKLLKYLIKGLKKMKNL